MPKNLIVISRQVSDLRARMVEVEKKVDIAEEFMKKLTEAYMKNNPKEEKINGSINSGNDSP